jgi:hypothetical protein
MTRLRSYSRSMREVFEESVSVRYLASALASYDAERTATKIRDWMVRKDYHHIGVRRDGIVVGYALRDQLAHGILGDHLVEFAEEDVVSGQMPMLEALERVRDRRRVFVSVLGEVSGIVTRSDVTKPPVRLWLFGLVMIFEMQISRLIRARYPEDSWVPLLSSSQVKDAKKNQAALSAQGTEMELADLLTLSAKQHLLTSSADLMEMLDLGTQEGQALIGRVRQLRNGLAHVHDISHHWPEFLDVARAVEDVIERAEGITRRRFRDLAVPDNST